MKKYSYLYLTLLLASTLAIPKLTFARSNIQNSDIPDQVYASPDIFPSPTISATPTPLPVSSPVLKTIRDRIRADYQKTLQNVRNNGDYRNNILETVQEASVPTPAPAKTADVESIQQAPAAVQTPVSTPLTTVPGAKITSNQTKAQNSSTYKLEMSLNALKNIRDRINAKIQADQENGLDTTEAQTLLDTADKSLSASNQTVAALIAMTNSDQKSLASNTNQKIQLKLALENVLASKNALSATLNSLTSLESQQ